MVLILMSAFWLSVVFVVGLFIVFWAVDYFLGLGLVEVLVELVIEIIGTVLSSVSED